MTIHDDEPETALTRESVKGGILKHTQHQEEST